ncbi:hypothetical protein KC343_g8008 [Hortaea werneckii]|uniref:YAG7-like dimerisation domain-containing protein n=1 Tax=Hortaea werneckii TaxID=91943 RepID=A0A3M7DGU3_HORWE|nr:hypothetical protein KC323_g2642 [Hortaea werneckii]KAI6871635.1 hypothetical protein KC338_g2484 [Hortaea werneckii]KAI7162544.1 hypothetical protein KC352_g26665 [Hortaea werneckii]KAI7356193.1 hypothetical protein KC320_g2385 [Hortaea werneckii]KAI7621470.1 hypothetical protein KC343_g8008 [Hortaea werneckii]
MSSGAMETQNPVPSGESKSARKKRAKAEAEANGTLPAAPAIPQIPADDNSTQGVESDGVFEHPHVKELQKQIRNLSKRLTGLQKVDDIQNANPGLSLNDLVAQRKINQDQKAAAEKKPQIQAQLKDVEAQVQVFRSVNAEYLAQLQKQKDELAAQHQQQLQKVKEDARLETMTSTASELRKNLLVFSQFLRAAAAKRNIEEESNTNESMAFEGALLLVYGGDEKAVEAAVNIIEGADQEVPSIEGPLSGVKYSQIKQTSVDYAPFPTEETWTNGGIAAQEAVPAGSDPTIANVGLTELQQQQQPSGIPAPSAAAQQDQILSSPANAGLGVGGGNLAAEQWDTTAGAQQADGNGMMDESYEVVPRPNQEVENPAPAPASAPAQPQASEKVGGTSWADEITAAEPVGDSGNKAGESWDMRAAGQAPEDGSWGGAEPVQEGDGFTQIPSRPRGAGPGARGNGRGRGDGGQFRGRGRGRGGFRGDGDFRGRGRGGARARGGPRGEATPRS